MPRPPRILAFAGSARQGSLNKKLVRVAAAGAAATGAEITIVDLVDYPLPVYDADLEKSQGLPENARRLKAVFAAHDAFLISSPENNSSISALLKNVIDWTSRPSAEHTGLTALRGKVAALVSASPGALGGLRGLVHTRNILENIGVLVIPQQKAVPKADTAFDPDGNMVDEAQRTAVEAVGRALAEIAARLTAPE